MVHKFFYQIKLVQKISWYFSSFNSCPYEKPVDIWAIGCIACELANGRPLFPGKQLILLLVKLNWKSSINFAQCFDTHRFFTKIPSNLLGLRFYSELFLGIKMRGNFVPLAVKQERYRNPSSSIQLVRLLFLCSLFKFSVF